MLDELSLHKGVEFAVKTEEVGQKAYSLLAEKFKSDGEISGLFARLARDEEAHRRQFLKLLENLPPEEGVTRQDDRYQYLRAMSISEFFMGTDGLLKEMERIGGVDDALSRALELEKATLLYYRAMQDIIGESDILSSVILAEKKHVVRLMGMIDRLGQAG